MMGQIYIFLYLKGREIIIQLIVIQDLLHEMRNSFQVCFKLKLILILLELLT